MLFQLPMSESRSVKLALASSFRKSATVLIPRQISVNERPVCVVLYESIPSPFGVGVVRRDVLAGTLIISTMEMNYLPLHDDGLFYTDIPEDGYSPAWKFPADDASGPGLMGRLFHATKYEISYTGR